MIDAGAGQMLPTTLVSLAPWGIDAQAFAAGLPAGSEPAWFVVLDASGNELGRGVGPAAATPAP